MKRVHIILFMLFASFIMASAQYFEAVNDDGVTIYYVVNNHTTTASVISSSTDAEKYSGTVVIPEEVTYNNQTYRVTEIAQAAFHCCNNLTSVVIPNSILYINDGAFNSSPALNSVNIPESVISVSKNVFYNSGIWNNEENWENDVLYIDNCLIETKYDKLTGHYNIKDGTRLIAENGFFYCTGMTSITIPNTVKYINEGAFFNCTGLTSIEIPNSVTSIEMETFAHCKGLTSVKIPNSITNIGIYAFWDCPALTSIEIPKSVTFIAESAFSNCTGLRSVTVANEDPANITMHHKPFFGVPTDLCTLYVPKGSKELYATAEYWKEFANIVETNTSVGTVPQDSGKTTYYDLKGLQVENPVVGNIYIQVQDGVATKVVYRE